MLPAGIDDDVERTDNLPVSIDVAIAATRSVEEAKKEFEEGDVIHIEAKFKRSADGDGEFSYSRYGAMVYKKKEEFGTTLEWTPLEKTDMLSWPNDAVSGTFTAYYIYGSSGVLSDNTNESDNVVFSELHDGIDPLVANVKNVRYGHTIGLVFEHLLTHLSLTDLDPGVADKLLFTKYQNGNKPDTETEGAEFHNACRFVLANESNGTGIKVVYTQVMSKAETPGGSGDGSDGNGDGGNGSGSGGNTTVDKVYIAAPMEVVLDAETGVKRGRAGFFLEPGDYEEFHVLFPNAGPYIDYENSKSLRLEGNYRYEFSVVRSAGVTLQPTTPPEEEWDESEDPLEVIVDVEAFLRALASGKSYEQEEKLILQPTENGVVKLLCNIDFDYIQYTVFAAHDDMTEFVPDLGSGITFDGGHHYIYHTACPLFNTNNGTIKNLGIADVIASPCDNIVRSKHPNGRLEALESNVHYTREDLDYTGGDFENKRYDLSNHGLIAMRNTGTVNNVRVRNVDMTVQINTLSAADDDSAANEGHNVGILFGRNNGTVSEVYLSERLKLTIENYNGATIMPGVSIGGLAGENMGGASISDICKLDVNNKGDAYEPLKIIINNLLDGDISMFYVGGMVGNQSGKLINVQLTKVTVDNSKSRGVYAYLGGIAGRAVGDGVEISLCTIGGSVIAGTVDSHVNITAHSYTGGLAGYISESVTMQNCTSFSSVEGVGKDKESTGVKYGTGGAFGRIGNNATQGKMVSVLAFGNALSGVSPIGTFAGVAPVGKTWSDYSDEVEVKSFADIKEIGTNENEGQ